MDVEIGTLGEEGLQRFQALHADAISAVCGRFRTTYGSVYEQFGSRGQDACREDLAFHLEFLRPVLEFGLLQPMVDYLLWLDSVLSARAIPVRHVALSLDWLAEFYAGHMDAKEATVVSAALHAARTKFLKASDAPVAPKPPPEPWPEVAPFEAAVLTGDLRKALAVMNHCLGNGHSLVEFERRVIQPVLYHIGDQWQANQVSVAQEHMATAVVHSVMTMGLLRSPLPALINKRVLLACVEGNGHAIGLRMVVDAFQLAGWDVQYLGADVPTGALVQQTVEWRPDLVGLSVSFAQQLRAVKVVIAQLNERLGRARPAVIVGGFAINRYDRLAGMVGADGSCVDAQAAVDYADRLVGDQGAR
ncbi:MAG: cobalamin-dependent protein [Nitrospirae bacterium]|nr:cobalamin-dependent protein [Nitrospirota bacterium]